MTTAAADRILTDWRAWHARTLRALFLADGYLPGDWGAANESYEAAWLAALAPQDRWALRVGEAYDTLAGVLADRAVARELARWSALVDAAAVLQTQFDHETFAGGMALARTYNQELAAKSERARTRATIAAKACVRDSASLVTRAIADTLR